MRLHITGMFSLFFFFFCKLKVMHNVFSFLGWGKAKLFYL